MNEKITESIFRNELTKNGYFANDSIIVEEQKSNYHLIDKLLKNASKKGVGKGFPEFIIRSEEMSDFLIIAECKADVKKHESETSDQYGDYAVDGVLLYSSFLSKEFDVLGIAVSGQNETELKVSHYLFLKNTTKPHKYFSNKILPLVTYYDEFLKSDFKFGYDYDKLLEYIKDLNELLHSKKIKEAQRSLLISGVLIALQNIAFKNSFTSHKKPEQLAKNLLSTIIHEFTNANLPIDKVNNLKQTFSFILTHTTIITDKDFFIELIKSIDDNINKFMRTHKYFDTLGQFYIEFLRYANNDKGLGIVLTPPHITDLFSEIAGIDKDSVIFDNCCGTGGFLISAMKKMIKDAKGDSFKIKQIKNHQLIGIEYQDDIYALGVSNMVIHGDGKTNIYSGNCFKLSETIKQKFHPDFGFLNPPYKSKKSDIEELDFVINNLNTIKKGGTCIAIVPLSCAISTKGEILERKKNILSDHTLEAVLSMPDDLFHNSKVGVITCVLVIKAHIPHPENKKTWLGYWREDGFIKTKGKGRIDLNNTWVQLRNKWINSFVNREVVKRLSVMEALNPDDEWCAEGYLITDYSEINYETYKNYVRRYLAFRLLNDLLDFKIDKVAKPTEISNQLVHLSKIFNVKNGLASSSVEVREEAETENDIRYIRPSQSYSGSIAGYVDKLLVDDKHIYQDQTIYVSTDGQGSHTYSYVSSFEFIPNSNVSILIPKDKMSLQEKIYYSICITINRYKFSYGRKPKGNRLKNILIPECPPDFVYNQNVFQEIFEGWKKIVK
ncbi:MAG TPA: methyltransferase [Desulfobacteraceae bacterium]|nr:methyltransferase [Desulfobacteraceae bacterium]